MRILTWNCNGAFRKKFHEISRFNADIYVIQECEDPKQSADQDYKDWAKNYFWIGTNKHKGLGVFCTAGLDIKELDWPSNNLELFLPCRINDQFNLLAVWTKQANSPNFAYIGQLWKYLQLNKDKLSKFDSFVVGDLNSNKIWDEWDRWWNHSDVVRELKEIGIESSYHILNREEQGGESRPTLFMQRNIKKPYHIDYIFCPSFTLAYDSKIVVGDKNEWLHLSDHMPVVFESSNELVLGIKSGLEKEHK